VAKVAALDPEPVVAAGNHDLMAVGRLLADGLGPLPERCLEWTWDVLEPAARDYLEELPMTAETADGAVVVAHGSLDDPVEYVNDAAAGAEQLRRLLERRPEAQVLVLGHTHHPLECTLDGGLALYNPGSVGQSRERRAVARAMVLDAARGAAQFMTVDYDVRTTRRELRAAGLPAHACHLAPRRLAAMRRRVGRG
jgi:predicted phosphodiesterase